MLNLINFRFTRLRETKRRKKLRRELKYQAKVLKMKKMKRDRKK